MPKEQIKCDACGCSFMRYPSVIREHNFCSRECAKTFTSSRMSDYNRNDNVKNTSEGWSDEQREAVRHREQKNKGPCGKNTYPKEHGRHAHRVAAEKKIGRKLKPGEVVHHIDGDKHNNDPENLIVFKNQQEHVKYHAEHPEESGVYLGKRVI